MHLRTMIVSAVLAAFWLLGLWDQMHSAEAAMRYLAISLGLVAIAVWRWQPQRRLKPRRSERPRD